MLTKKSTMRICRFCKAPNPERLAACYACGGSLTTTDPNLPKEGETTFSCMNCQGAIPYRATACPHCGRSLAHEERSPERQRRATRPPEGWQAQSLPDGSTVLKRATWNRWFKIALPQYSSPFAQFGISGVISTVLFLTWFLAFRFLPSDNASAVVIWTFVIGFAAIVAWLLVSVLMKEEIRAGKNFLEMRRDLWFYHRYHRIENGFLRVNTEHHIAPSRHTSQLGGFGDVPGATQHVWIRSLYVSTRDTSVYIHQTSQTVPLWDGDTAGRGFACDEIAQLSLYLADITEWQIFDPSAQRNGK